MQKTKWRTSSWTYRRKRLVFDERGEDSKTDNRVPHTLGEQIANSFHYDRDRLGF